MNGNNQIEYVIEKRGIRHARINVNEDFRVRLIVPNDFTDEDIESLKSKKSRWINENLNFFRKSIPEEIKLSLSKEADSALENYKKEEIEKRDKKVLEIKAKAIKKCEGLRLLDKKKLEKAIDSVVHYIIEGNNK